MLGFGPESGGPVSDDVGPSIPSAVSGIFSLGAIGNPCCPCSGSSGCACATRICIGSCRGGVIAGAVVSVAGFAPVTTLPNGCTGISLCLDSGGGAGTYKVTVTAPGFRTYSNELMLTCGGVTTITLLPIGSPPSVTFTVYGCWLIPLQGAIVDFGGAEYLTNSAGQVTIAVTDPGTYPWIVNDAPRFNTQTGSITIAALCATGATVGVRLSPASGYYCCDPNGETPTCAYPWAATLMLTDSVYGSTSVSYDAVLGYWTGTLAGLMSPGTGGCAAHGFTMGYQWSGSSTMCCEPDSNWYEQAANHFCPGNDIARMSGCFGAGGGTFSTTGPPLVSIATIGVSLPCEVVYPAGATLTVTE